MFCGRLRSCGRVGLPRSRARRQVYRLGCRVPKLIQQDVQVGQRL